MKTWFIAILFLAAALAACGAAAPERSEGSVLLHVVAGDVEIRKSEFEGWRKTKADTSLAAGASVRALKGGEAVLRWPGGHTVKLSQFTTMVMAGFSDGGGSEKTLLNISGGRILARVEKLKGGESSFQVKTPTAIAGVRGTEFAVDVTEEKSTFMVLEGQLAVVVDNMETVLDINFQMEVEPGIQPAEPEAIPEEVKQKISVEMDKMKEEAPAPAAAPEGRSENAPEMIEKTVDDIMDQGLQGEIIEEYSTPGKGCCDM